MLEELKKLLKHTTIYGFGTIVGKVIGFLLIPLYTHYLTTSDYGVLELLDLTISVLGIFVGLGINAAIFRFYYQYETDEEKNEVITTALIFVFVVDISILALTIWKASFISDLVFGKTEYSLYFRFMFVSFFFSIISSVPEAYIMARQKSALFTGVTLGTLTINVTLNIIVVAILKKGILGVVFVSALMRCLNTSFWLAYLVPRVVLRFSVSKLREMLRYGVPLIPANCGLYAINFADRFFLSHLSTLASVGIYALGHKFGFMVSLLLIQPFNRIWQAQLFEIAKKDDADIVFGKIFTYFIFVLVFGVLGLSVLGKEIVEIVSAPSFHAAYKVIPLIAGAFLFRGCYIYFRTGLFISKQTHLIGLSVLGAALLNLILNYILIQKLEFMGSAITALVTNAFMAGALFYFSNKIFSIKYEKRRILKLMFVASSLGVAGFFIELGSLVYTIGFKIALLMLFPAALLGVGFYSEPERKTAREVWCRMRKRGYVPGPLKSKP